MGFFHFMIRWLLFHGRWFICEEFSSQKNIHPLALEFIIGPFERGSFSFSFYALSSNPTKKRLSFWTSIHSGIICRPYTHTTLINYHYNCIRLVDDQFFVFRVWDLLPELISSSIAYFVLMIIYLRTRTNQRVIEQMSSFPRHEFPLPPTLNTDNTEIW